MRFRGLLFVLPGFLQVRAERLGRSLFGLTGDEPTAAPIEAINR